MKPRFPDIVEHMTIITETEARVYGDYCDPEYAYKGSRYRVQFRVFVFIVAPSQLRRERARLPADGDLFGTGDCMRVVKCTEWDTPSERFCELGDTIVVVRMVGVGGSNHRKQTWTTAVDQFITAFEMHPRAIVVNKAGEVACNSKRFALLTSPVGWLLDALGAEAAPLQPRRAAGKKGRKKQAGADAKHSLGELKRLMGAFMELNTKRCKEGAHGRQTEEPRNEATMFLQDMAAQTTSSKRTRGQFESEIDTYEFPDLWV